MSQSGTLQQVGYVEILRSNRDFRNLWIGGLISQTGDWFNSVALFTLLLSLTGSGEAVGYVLILKLIPTFFFGPFAGVVADRFNRKAVMIAADALRGLSVLGFLFIESADQVWMVYALTAAQVVIATFFEPAKSAAIPNIVTREQLIAANALSGATWSVTLAVGAALGGVVTDSFGRDAAFIIDAASFFVSAIFVSLARVPSPGRSDRKERKPGGRGRISVADVTGFTDLVEGGRYLRANPRVMALLMVKSGWGLGGGVLLLLTVFGKEIFPLGRDGSASIGLMYAARGIGALIGPIIARAITDASTRTMRRVITASFFISAVFYLLFAQASVVWLAALWVIGAHAGGSIQWVFSTTLLQMAVPNRFLGRVFAAELALVTLTMSLSTYMTGWGLDNLGASPRAMAMALGLVFIAPGAAWFAIERRLSRSEAAAPPPLVIETKPATETSFPPGD